MTYARRLLTIVLILTYANPLTDTHYSVASMPHMDKFSAWYKVITESYRGEPDDATKQLRSFTKPLRMLNMDPFLKIDTQLYKRTLLRHSPLKLRALIAPHTSYLQHAWVQNALVLQWLIGHVLIATLSMWYTVRTVAARVRLPFRTSEAPALCSPVQRHIQCSETR